MISINFNYRAKDGEYVNVEVNDHNGQPIKKLVEDALEACKSIDADIDGEAE